MVDLESVKKVAELARLRFTEEELKNLTHQLTTILESFETIAQVPTDGLEPMVTPVAVKAEPRGDDVEESYSAEELLENAPDKMGSLVRVPPVV